MIDIARRALRIALIVAGSAALTVPMAAGAQFQSQGYQFLKAVRDADGDKATQMLNQPGTTVVDARDVSSGQAALHIVVERRDLTWLNFLAGKGASLNIKDKQGNTPLMLAVQGGFIDGIESLVRRKARVDEPNNAGETPLIRAVQRRDLRMIRLLLDGGANPDRRDTLAGLSARDYAKRDSRNPEILKTIEDAGKTPKAPKLMGPEL